MRGLGMEIQVPGLIVCLAVLFGAVRCLAPSFAMLRLSMDSGSARLNFAMPDGGVADRRSLSGQIVQTMRDAMKAPALLLVTLTLFSAQASAQTPVERGRYLVNAVMSCHNCHTPMGPNGPDFSRALSGGLTFDEPTFKVTASNITPDKNTGVGAWSDEELKEYLVTGMRPNGIPTAPIMPTGFYTRITPRDLSAVVAYLRSVKPISNVVPMPEYKQAVKPEIGPYAGGPVSDDDMKDPVTRGMYLVRLAHCLECHTPSGPSGRDDANSTGKGGSTFRGPFGESVSANITSHPTAGLGRWTDAEIKRAITQGVSRDGRKLKPPMAYAFYAQIAPSDLDAIVKFLRTLPPKE